MTLPLRSPGALALLALLAPSLAAAQGEPAAAPPSDPVLVRLVEESLAARPELRQAQELARAERERVSQAGSLPDPVVTLGIQNDGFDGLKIGEMDSSYYLLMVSQGIPWPGKLWLRTDLARLAAEQADAGLARALLTTEADVRRAYLDLLLVRDRLALLGELGGIWQKSAGVARARYESGEGAQSDVLRAQLELNRLQQRRWALQSDERVTVQGLNRLRAHPLDEPVPTTAHVVDLPLPPVVDEAKGWDDAAARSPELRQARLATTAAETGVSLARRGLIPDVAVSAGIMPRGALEPMWQAGVSFTVPVWAWRKQGRAIAESSARAAAGQASAAAIEQQLRLRLSERRSALGTLLDTVKLYREGLLVQSQATAESTLSQYRVGRVTFASVLDANAGYVADKEGLLLAIASAVRLGIADAEVSLAPGGGALASGGGRGGSIPGAGAAGGGPSGSKGGAEGAPAGGDGGGASMGM
jgi:outer membrane protein TolC